MKIAHLSDLHFGHIDQPSIVDAVVEDINERDVDLVVISGDLTQRGRHREYEKALSLLDALKAPNLVVPGNHDVYAWWYPRLRMIRPLDRYRHYFNDELTPTFEKGNIAVLGLNSAHGHTIKGGKVGKEARERISRYFSDKENGIFKILVLHHHLTKLETYGRHDIARNARKTLERAVEAGVDLILCGHLHVSHIEPVEIIPADHRIIIASAGTATSSRGRKSNKECNFFNLITIKAKTFSIEERRFDLRRKKYISECVTHFEKFFT